MAANVGVMAHFPTLTLGLVADRPPGFLTDWQSPGSFTVTRAEARLLARCVRMCVAKRILEIGAYIGFSTAHLALATAGEVQTVDSFREYRGTLGQFQPGVMARFWENLARCGCSERVHLTVGESPDVLVGMCPPDGWDFVFVDGWHLDGQPMRDVQAVAVLAPGCVLALHDLWMPDVAAAGDWLTASGWRSVILRTPGRLGFFWRHESPGMDAFEGVCRARGIGVGISE